MPGARDLLRLEPLPCCYPAVPRCFPDATTTVSVAIRHVEEAEMAVVVACVVSMGVGGRFEGIECLAGAQDAS
jgi:hypothetical protein